jgi:LysM repeat protein
MSDTTPLSVLHRARQLSDQKQYEGKGRLLHLEMFKHPDDWVVDDDQAPNPGLTHTPTGYQFHLPRTHIPSSVLNRKRLEPADTSTHQTVPETQTKEAMIKKEGDEYVLYTKDGDRVLGRHPTRQDAIKQEYAIQKSQEKSAEKRLYFFEGRNTGIVAESEAQARAKKKRGGDNLVKVRDLSESDKKDVEAGRWVRTRQDGKSPQKSEYGKGQGYGPARKQAGTGPRTHTLQAGENPSVLAQRYGVRVRDLMEANPHLKDPNRLQIGTQFTIPEPPPPPPPLPPFDSARFLHAVSAPETGGESNPWIRTRKPFNARGSGAYGPYQITPTLVEDMHGRRSQFFENLPEPYVQDFLEQGKYFSKWGTNPYAGVDRRHEPGYDPKFDYGGQGTYVPPPGTPGHEEAAARYQALAEAVLDATYYDTMRAGLPEGETPEQAMLRRWRGHDPEPQYLERFQRAWDEWEVPDSAVPAQPEPLPTEPSPLPTEPAPLATQPGSQTPAPPTVRAGPGYIPTRDNAPVNWGMDADGRPWYDIPQGTPDYPPNYPSTDDLIRSPSAPTPVPVKSGAADTPRTGPQALARALSAIDLDALEAEQRDILKSGAKSKRSRAIHVLNIIEGMRRNEVTPDQLLISQVPVIPAQFRPFSAQGTTFIPGDANVLYKDLMNLKQAYEQERQVFGPEGAGATRAALYDGVKAVYGFGPPTNEKARAKDVSGFLQKVLGRSSKYGYTSRRLLGKTQDSTARSVIGVNPDLGMDEIGLPEDMAWTLYGPWVQRRLVRSGMGPGKALESVRDRSDHARKALEREMEERPAVYSRSPVWHKYGIVAGRAKLVDGKSIEANPYTVEGLGGDFDGDTFNVHLPATDESVQEAKDRLFPSKMLFKTRDPEQTYGNPKHEAVLGLSNAMARPAKNRHVFRSQDQALDAIRKHRISLQDEIEIDPNYRPPALTSPPNPDNMDLL